MQTPLSVEAALEQILDAVVPLGVERVDFLSALGRVLAEDVVAVAPVPPWANSAMDGYAVRHADLEAAPHPPSRQHPVELRVVEEIPAGRAALRPLGPGEAARIMTGAPLPPGADTVVPVEETEARDGRVRLFARPQRGAFVRPAGQDVEAGERVLPAGTRVTPAVIGMLAQLRRTLVAVHRAPRVAIVSTGDELLEPDDPRPAAPDRATIVNSNAYQLAAAVREAGGEPLVLGIAADRPEAIREKIDTGLRAADVLLSSGGVSVGEYDYVRRVLADLGAELRVWQIAVRPGKPLVFGLVAGRPFFGLPGNPVSSLVTFELFVRPALRRMLGVPRHQLFRPVVEAELRETLTLPTGRRHYLRCRVSRDASGAYTAVTTGNQDSAVLKSLVLADGLLVVPEDRPEVRAGERFPLILLT
ncbi:MAG TPA: gephyrin-like molybdotransferase Glp [Thermodesulfobacteriota bacterium]|nr:gephyrin-like molybdotransferase Glp [Thermodesulfobacteriota bacterium]